MDAVRDYAAAVLQLVIVVAVNLVALFIAPAVFVYQRALSRAHRRAVPAATGPRSVFITGASSGIGAAMALHLARDHPRTAALYLCGRSGERLKPVADACTAAGPSSLRVVVVQLDVSDRTAVRRELEAADAAEQRTPTGGLSVVIANAGITGTTSKKRGLELMDEILQVNLMGSVYAVSAAAEMMASRNSGSVVLISSQASYVPSAPLFSAYGTSKVGQRFLGEAMRVGLEGTGVDVLVVCPSFTESEMTKKYNVPKMTAEAVARRIIAAVDRGGVGVLDISSYWITPALLAALGGLPLQFRVAYGRLMMRFYKRRGDYLRCPN